MWKGLIFPSHINLTETEKGLENLIKSGFPVQMSAIRTQSSPASFSSMQYKNMLKFHVSYTYST